MKIKNGLNTIKYQIFLLAVMLFNSALVFPKPDEISHIRYSYYLADYSIAYCTRLLVGEVLSHFKTAFTFEWLTDYFAVVVVVAAVLSALYIGSWLGKAEKKDLPIYLVLALVFATFPFAFAYFSSTAGLLDIYLFIITLIALAILNVPVLKWLIPALCVVAMLVHPAFAVTFYPVIFVLMLYKTVKSERKLMPAALMTVTLLFTAAVAVYVAFYEKTTVKMPIEEMSAYLKAKLPIRDTQTMEYFLYGRTIVIPEGEGYVAADSLLQVFKTMTWIAWHENQLPSVLNSAAALVPSFALFNYIWIKSAKACEIKGEKAVYTVAVLMVLMLPFTWTISTDVARFASLYFICQFLILVQFLRSGNTNVKNAFADAAAFAVKNPLVLAAAACMMYIAL